MLATFLWTSRFIATLLGTFCSHYVDLVFVFGDGNGAIQWVSIKEDTEIEMETLSQELQ